MNYKNMNTFAPIAGAVKQYLNKLGITEADSFLHSPKESDYLHYSLLDNVEETITGLHELFEKNANFFLQVDSDVDGFTSASEFYNFFKRIYPEAKIEYRLHSGKEHGVVLNSVPVYTDAIIIPDAGSNQVDELEELSNKGKKVFVMDHHVVGHTYTFENVIVVNNQSSERFTNKFLSGAGVVYKVLQAYDEKYNCGGIYKDYEDLAALGIIADMMDTRTLDNNAIIWNGLHNVKSPMLKALLKQQEYSVDCSKAPNKIDIAFYVAPLINAVIRSGSLDEKTDLFKGFISYDSDEVVVTTCRGKERQETLYEYLARCSANLRARQNNQKDKSIDAICDQIESRGLDKNKVLILKINASDVPQTITGLVAMEIQKRYSKPTLVLRPVLENGYIYYRGSGRASIADGFTSFMKELQKSGLIDYAEGHDNAFGASVLESNIEPLTEFLNKDLEGIDFADYNEVDCCLDDSNWNNNVLQEFGEIVDIFGNGIPQPKFHFDFVAGLSDFRIQGKNGDSLKIQHNRVMFVTFKNKELVDEYLRLSEIAFKEHKDIGVEVIGRSQINEWQGYRNINIMIDSIELHLVDKKVKMLF